MKELLERAALLYGKSPLTEGFEMKKQFLSLAATVALSGCCVMTPVSNVTDLSKVDFTNSYEFKEGSDCSYSLLGILPITNGARFISAVQDGDISKVFYVEHDFRFYGLFGSHCVHVYGK